MNNYGASLNFDLPKQSDAHYCALHGERYRKVLRNLDYWIETTSMDDPASDALLEGVRQKIRTFLNVEGILLYSTWDCHGRYIEQRDSNRKIERAEHGANEGKSEVNETESRVFPGRRTDQRIN